MQQGAPVAGNFLRAAFSFIPGADFLQQRPGDAFRGVFWAERAGIMGNVPLQAVQQGRKARTNDGSPGAEPPQCERLTALFHRTLQTLSGEHEA